MKDETIAVSTSAIGNVHQTISTTFEDNVNKYAIGKTNITSLSNAVKKGLKA